MKKVIMMLLMGFVLLFAGCSLGPVEFVEEDYGLLSVRDQSELTQLFKSSQEKNYFWDIFGFRGGIVNDAVGMPEANLDGDTTYKSSDYTQTNVQVDGVDEGDIVKTDGSRIYSIKHNELHVVQLLGDGLMELVLLDVIESDNPETYTGEGDYYYSGTYYSDLYVTEKYLIVLGQHYQYFVKFFGEEDDQLGLRYYNYSYINTTLIKIFDIETLDVVDEYEISGNVLSSRLIDDQLYIISSYQPYYSFYSENEIDLRPWFYHQDEATYIDFNDIKYLPDLQYRAYTIITSVVLEDELTYENDVFLGSSGWGQIYVNHQGIYLAANYYFSDFWGNYNNKGILISYQFHEASHRVIFGGMGSYSGYVINQFAMDEYNGYMRIATTEGWGDTAVNRLYVFERHLVEGKYQLDVVGYLSEGLGKPRETIRSARFNQDLATIVTFEQVDPFYAIDLSDPTNPTIVSYIEKSGFDTYQQPWKENYIIGIGFETDSTGRTTGMRLSLYDSSNPENFVQVGESLILNNNETSWAYSEALYNHKSIMVDESRNYIGFALWRSNWSNGYYSSMNDYLVFEIDEADENPIQIKHTVNHIDYYQTNDDLYPYYWYYSFTIERGIRIDDYLYVISGEVITSHNLIGDFSLIDEVIFQADRPNTNQ